MRDTGCELRVAGCGLRVAGCGLRVASCGLRVTRFGLCVAGYEVRVVSFAGLGGLVKIMLPSVLSLITSDPASSPSKLTQKADLKE